MNVLSTCKMPKLTVSIMCSSFYIAFDICRKDQVNVTFWAETSRVVYSLGQNLLSNYMDNEVVQNPSAGKVTWEKLGIETKITL